MASRKHRMVLRAGRALVTLGILFTVCVLFLPLGMAFVRLTFSNGAVAFWPNAQATLNLRLGCPSSGSLPNWGPCWDDAATDAATRWNSAGSRFRFRRPSVAWVLGMGWQSQSPPQIRRGL